MIKRRRVIGLAVLLLAGLMSVPAPSGQAANTCPEPRSPNGGGGVYFDCMTTQLPNGEARFAWGNALSWKYGDKAKHIVASRMSGLKHRASRKVHHAKRRIRHMARKGKKVTGGGKLPWRAGEKLGRWMRRNFPPGKIKDRLKGSAIDCGVFGLAGFALTWSETHSKKAGWFAGANACAGAVIAKMKK